MNCKMRSTRIKKKKKNNWKNKGKLVKTKLKEKRKCKRKNNQIPKEWQRNAKNKLMIKNKLTWRKL